MSDLDRDLDEQLSRTGQASEAEQGSPEPRAGASGELGRLLAAASRLRRAPSPSLDPASRSRIRSRVFGHVREHTRSRSLLGRRFTRPAYAVALASLLTIAAGTAAAQDALPGDPLHGWKLASEQVGRALYPDRLGFEIFLAERRAGELLAIGRGTESAPATRGLAESLRVLVSYSSATDRLRIQMSLADEQARLRSAGLESPAIEVLFLALGLGPPGLPATGIETDVATPEWVPTLLPLPTLELP